MPPIEYLINLMKFNAKFQFSIFNHLKCCFRFDFAKIYEKIDTESFLAINSIENLSNETLILFAIQIFNKGMIDHLLDQFSLEVIILDSSNSNEKLNITQCFYIVFEDAQYFNQDNNFTFQTIQGEESNIDIINFSHLSTLKLDESLGNYRLIADPTINFTSRSFLKLYFLIDTLNFQNNAQIFDMSLNFNQNSTITSLI